MAGPRRPHEDGLDSDAQTCSLGFILQPSYFILAASGYSPAKPSTCNLGLGTCRSGNCPLSTVYCRSPIIRLIADRVSAMGVTVRYWAVFFRETKA